ncbi:MAG: hypothetical protein JXR96_12970 [Deltaproteobacteria bacterium]|nr:hypothetical protein [Deltaproteobacteria bacterium]
MRREPARILLLGMLLVSITAPVRVLGAPGSEGPDAASDWAREEEDRDGAHRFFLGLHGGFHLPYGPWTEHRLAGESSGEVTHPNDLTQVGPGGGGILELGARYGRHVFTIQLDAGVLTPGTWQSYARQHGSDISVSLSKWDLNAIWGVELLRVSSFFIQARLGLGYMVVLGTEESRDYRLAYAYPFFRHSFSARAGICAGLEVARGADLLVTFDESLGVPGVEYENDSSTRLYLGTTFSLGLRLWPLAWLQ